MRGLISGFTAVLRGAKMLAGSRRLKRLAVMPVALSLVTLVLLSYLFLHYGQAYITAKLPADGIWATLGTVASTVVLLLGAVVAAFYASMLISQPFMDPLSAATEAELESLPVTAGGGGVRAVVREGWLVVVDVAVDMFWLVVIQALLLLLHFTPFGWLQPVLAWTAAAWFTGTGIVCSPLVRRGWRGRKRWRVMRRHFGVVLGVGTGAALLAMVPLAQLLTLPIAVVGGTMAMVDVERAGRLPHNLPEAEPAPGDA
ncbi:MAG: EI24 domain-containing protein [Armatimonadetes bacterium]|nr:EI24 domain-containing protein [Armatimonadota bacterium]